LNYGDLITNIIVLVGTKRKWVTKKLKEELKNFPSLSKPIGSAKVNAKRGEDQFKSCMAFCRNCVVVFV
jgi:hypothetical protein